MPGSKRSRKHSKWASQATAQRELVGERRLPPDKEYVSDAKRRQNQIARSALADKFAALSPGVRRDRQDEFRRLLRHVCTSESECRGFWSLRFSPLLASNAPAAPRPKPRVQRAPRAVVMDPKATVAIMALVAEYPDVLTQKTCAMVLVGSTSPKLSAAGHDRAALFGRLRGTSAKSLSKQIDLAITSGRISRTPQGLLTVASGSPPAEYVAPRPARDDHRRRSS